MQYERPSVRVACAGLLILSTLVGCRKEPEPARWDIDVLAPLLNTRFTIADIIPDSLQSVGPDGAITLVYSEALFAVELDTVLEIPDTSFVYAYALPLPGNDQFSLPAGFPIISQNNLIRFNLPDVELSTLTAREGVLDLRMKNMMGSIVNGSFTLPGATFTDGPSTLEASVGPGNAGSPTYSSTQRSLAGATFDLRGPNFNQVNTLASSVSAQLDPDGTGATVTNQDSVIVTAAYHDLVPQYARGYFGSRTINVGPSTNRLGLFNNFVSGTLDLDRVRLKVKVENSIGMDLRIRLNSLQAVNTRTGVTVDMEHSILDGPINLNRAVDLGSTAGSTVYDNVLDNDDSNVDLFLENLPDELQYSLDLDLNPLGNISNGNDFIYHDSRLEALLELEVPLNIIATDLVLENIVRPDLPGNEEDQTIREGGLTLFATNGFPFSGQVVLDIVDRDRNFLSSVPVEGNVAPGLLGADGLVSASTSSALHASLTAEQIDMLYGEGRFRVRIAFNTSDQTQHLRLLQRYAMDLQITVGARYFVNGDE